jgi:hypothetical protein
MTGKTFIDNCVQYFLNIGNATQNADTLLRPRILMHLQKRVRRMWRWKPWPWKLAQDTVAISVDGWGTVPLDYASLGRDGGLYHTTLLYELRWAPARRLFYMLETETSTNTRPRWWTISGQSPITAPVVPGLELIWTAPRPTTQTNFTLVYELKAPEITDTDDTPYSAGPPVVPALSSGLSQIPEDWWDTVLFPGVIADLMMDDGDGRAAAKEAEFQRGLAEAWVDSKQDRHVSRRPIPRYGRGKRSVFI